MGAQDQFWSEYYKEVVHQGTPWLDYSNERVQAQTFGLALEAAGPVRGRHCLDIGCGWGDFCLTLATCHASSVTGVDIVPELIAELAGQHGSVRWLCGTLQDEQVVSQLASYDIAFLLEVLQLVPLAHTLRTTWDHLLPGGRLIAIVPNARCPIVSQTQQRLPRYSAPALGDITSALGALPDLRGFMYRGLSFARDQSIVPYEVSTWRADGGWPSEPNRIQFVALKAGERAE